MCVVGWRRGVARRRQSVRRRRRGRRRPPGRLQLWGGERQWGRGGAGGRGRPHPPGAPALRTPRRLPEEDGQEGRHGYDTHRVRSIGPAWRILVKNAKLSVFLYEWIQNLRKWSVAYCRQPTRPCRRQAVAVDHGPQCRLWTADRSWQLIGWSVCSDVRVLRSAGRAGRILLEDEAVLQSGVRAHLPEAGQAERCEYTAGPSMYPSLHPPGTPPAPTPLSPPDDKCTAIATGCPIKKASVYDS